MSEKFSVFSVDLNNIELVPYNSLESLAETSHAINYYTDQTHYIYKFFDGNTNSNEYHMFIIEQDQALMIANAIKQGNLSPKHYMLLQFASPTITMIHKQPQSMLIYPYYPQTLHHFLINSKTTDVDVIEQIMRQVIEHTIILYQKLTMAHHNLNPHTIYLNESNQPIIGGFGFMERENHCAQHLIDIMGFILTIQHYARGSIDHKPRPWLDVLLQPDILRTISVNSIDDQSTRIASITIDQAVDVFNYWVR